MSAIPSDVLPAGMGDLSQLPVDTQVPQNPQIPQAKPALQSMKVMQETKNSTDDPFKDPRVIESLKKESFYEDKAAAEIDPYISALHQVVNSPPPPPLPRSEAPKYQDFAKQASPWLMIITALGGKAAGLSGGNMIGALTGMVEGTQQGNQEAFDKAHQAWKENYESLMDDWKNKMEIYNAFRQMRKDKIDAEQQAIGAYRDIAGDYSAQAKNLISEHTGYERAIQQIQLANARLTKERNETGLKSERLQLQAADRADKAEAGLTRIDQAYAAVTDNLELLPALIERYKNTDGKGDKVIVPQKFSKFLISMSNDPELGQFAGNIASLKAALVGIDMPAGQRGNLFINQLFSGTAPEILTDSAATIQTKLMNDANVINEAKKRAEEKVMRWRSFANRTGPRMFEENVDIPPVVPRSEFPAEKSKERKTYTQQDLEDTIKAHPEMSRQDVIKALREQGLKGPE